MDICDDRTLDAFSLFFKHSLVSWGVVVRILMGWSEDDPRAERMLAPYHWILCEPRLAYKCEENDFQGRRRDDLRTWLRTSLEDSECTLLLGNYGLIHSDDGHMGTYIVYRPDSTKRHVTVTIADSSVDHLRKTAFVDVRSAPAENSVDDDDPSEEEWNRRLFQALMPVGWTVDMEFTSYRIQRNDFFCQSWAPLIATWALQHFTSTGSFSTEDLDRAFEVVDRSSVLKYSQFRTLFHVLRDHRQAIVDRYQRTQIADRLRFGVPDGELTDPSYTNVEHREYLRPSFMNLKASMIFGARRGASSGSPGLFPTKLVTDFVRMSMVPDTATEEHELRSLGVHVNHPQRARQVKEMLTQLLHDPDGIRKLNLALWRVVETVLGDSWVAEIPEDLVVDWPQRMIDFIRKYRTDMIMYPRFHTMLLRTPGGSWFPIRIRWGRRTDLEGSMSVLAPRQLVFAPELDVARFDYDAGDAGEAGDSFFRALSMAVVMSHWTGILYDSDPSSLVETLEMMNTRYSEILEVVLQEASVGLSVAEAVGRRPNVCASVVDLVLTDDETEEYAVLRDSDGDVGVLLVDVEPEKRPEIFRRMPGPPERFFLLGSEAREAVPKIWHGLLRSYVRDFCDTMHEAQAFFQAIVDNDFRVVVDALNKALLLTNSQYVQEDGVDQKDPIECLYKY